VILGSPVLDYGTNCTLDGPNCNSFIQNTAMVEDYLNLTSARGGASRQAYFDEISRFINSSDFAAYNSNCGSETWSSYIMTPAAQGVVAKLQKYISPYDGIDWTQADACTQLESPYGSPLAAYLSANYRIGKEIGFGQDVYDGRLLVPNDSADSYVKSIMSYFYSTLDPFSLEYLQVWRQVNAQYASDFDDIAYQNGLITYLTTYANYSNEPKGETGKANSDYNQLNLDTVFAWDRFGAESITAIHAALTADHDLKFMVLHGWDDMVCPETQTLWDLEQANLSKSVPIHTFEGGHMTYNTDSTRLGLKNTLVSFYRATRSGYSQSAANTPAH
jgi:hypothetical protein